MEVKKRFTTVNDLINELSKYPEDSSVRVKEGNDLFDGLIYSQTTEDGDKVIYITSTYPGLKY